ncbi:hypothetical protein RQCS_28560 [Rhodococcus qingshengii]|uniref:hypothetical protein n=1 Tax=Rhodococcus qingshengii TaxID=334542 RepID=UPI0007E5AF0B|nr:hypothetical protein [Rhodococcus qingshengii]BCF83311.1 hypothetical protein RQCS_28560 [Rhodococcus qingshengii]
MTINESTNGTAQRLPDGYGTLERFVDTWALDNAMQRANARAGSTIEEMRAFYSEMVPVAADAAESLRGTPIDQLDEQRTDLLKMLLCLVEVAVGVECFNGPKVPYGYDQSRLIVVPVPHMTPAF